MAVDTISHEIYCAIFTIGVQVSGKGGNYVRKVRSGHDYAWRWWYGDGGGPFAWMKNHFYPMDVYVVSSSRRSTVCTVAKSEETAMKYDIVVTLK